MPYNIAITGGPSTGKSTLAARLFADLKEGGYDYDIVFEERRKFYNEFQGTASIFDNFFLWRHQEREELRSAAKDGFVTDSPLFHFYVHGRQKGSSSRRDDMAIRELFRMCQEVVGGRYQLIVMARDPTEFPYRRDSSRSSTPEVALERHRLIQTFIEHFWLEKLLLVSGTPDERSRQVLEAVRTRYPLPSE